MTTPAPVEIRRYHGEAAFQQDAASMAAAGWIVVAQSQASAMSSSGQWCVALGIIGTIVGFLGIPLLILVGIVFVIIGVASREATYTVTYRATMLLPQTESPPAPEGTSG